jgi:hypothetical protein
MFLHLSLPFLPRLAVNALYLCPVCLSIGIL